MGLSASYIVEKKNLFKNTFKFGLTIGFLLKKKKRSSSSSSRRRRKTRNPEGINWEMRISRVCHLIK